KSLAGVLLAGTLAVTGATAASAQTDPPPATDHPKPTCESAAQHVATWQARLEHLKARVDDARVRRDELVAEGHLDQAQHLTDMIQRAEARIQSVQDRLTTVEQKVRDHCAPDATTAPDGETPAP
ncbi:MAG: hypothetical protein ABIV94_09650, partial [Acidimicrobiales bacterium]